MLLYPTINPMKKALLIAIATLVLMPTSVSGFFVSSHDMYMSDMYVKSQMLIDMWDPIAERYCEDLTITCLIYLNNK